MAVLPANVVVDRDLNAIAELAFHDLDGILFALLVLASCTVVRRSLWEMVSLCGLMLCIVCKIMSGYLPTRATTISKSAREYALKCGGIERVQTGS
jgi:hypothetical protein